jgi:hypothetical protein
MITLFAETDTGKLLGAQTNLSCQEAAWMTHCKWLKHSNRRKYI